MLMVFSDKRCVDGCWHTGSGEWRFVVGEGFAAHFEVIQGILECSKKYSYKIKSQSIDVSNS